MSRRTQRWNRTPMTTDRGASGASPFRAVPVLALAGCLAAGSLLALGGSSAVAAQESVAITNATIHTVSGEVIESGTVLIRDGRIAGLGAEVRVPSGTRIIDGTGKVVTPGLIESNSQVGLVEISLQADGTVDHTSSDLGASFNPLLGVNPRNTLIPIGRLRGITSAVIHPGGGGLFLGEGAMIALDGETVEAMTRSGAVSQYTGMEASGSGSRAATFRQLHDALWDARAHLLSEADAESDDPHAEGGRSNISGADLEALARVAAGEVALVVDSDRASDIRLALRLKEEFGIRMVLRGAREGWRVADEIAAAEVPVIVSPLVNLPDFEGLHSTYENAGRLEAAGVEVLLSTFSSHMIRDLPHAAGQAVRYGMDWSAALRAVTLGPAEVWGVADRVGSVEQGKIADLVVWSGDPFELSTSAEHVFIGGREVPMDSRQERLFDRYRTLPPNR